MARQRICGLWLGIGIALALGGCASSETDPKGTPGQAGKTDENDSNTPEEKAPMRLSIQTEPFGEVEAGGEKFPITRYNSVRKSSFR